MTRTASPAFDLDDATVAAMRQWAGECQWAEGDDLDLDTLPASLVVAAIERNYDGGVAGFIRDGI